MRNPRRHSRARDGGRAQAGLSLIEMLVALGVLSAIGLMLAQALHTSARASHKAADVERTISDRLVLRRVLGEWFEHAQSARITEDGRSFAGEANRISFTTLAPPFPNQRGFHAIDLRIEQAENGASRLRAVRRALREGGEARGIVLLDHAADLNFSYWDGTDWRAQWPSRAGAPSQVRLEFGEGAAPMVFALKVETPLACFSSRDGRNLTLASGCR